VSTTISQNSTLFKTKYGDLIILYIFLMRSGYMSPEYAMDGNFSVKSDVFSFGVLVLEIITGKKNRGFYYSNEDMNLLGNVRESATLIRVLLSR